ncbi:GNAT family N-acetyltransferase [Nocardia seriolae]|nr:GNAT family N-acetyltransferase [Nocardia seriolae]
MPQCNCTSIAPCRPARCAGAPGPPWWRADGSCSTSARCHDRAREVVRADETDQLRTFGAPPALAGTRRPPYEGFAAGGVPGKAPRRDKRCRTALSNAPRLTSGLRWRSPHRVQQRGSARPCPSRRAGRTAPKFRCDAYPGIHPAFFRTRVCPGWRGTPLLAFEQSPVPACRTATLADLDAIRTLEVVEFEHLAYPYFVLRQLFELHGANWTVIEESGEVRGYVLTAIGDRGAAWFLGFAVAADCQGRGIGRALLEAALDRCRRARAEQVYVTVKPGNRAAYHLYKEVGFVWTDHEGTYFGADEPRDVLVRRIYH